MIYHKNGAMVGRDTIDIDHQKVCIITAIDRTGNLYVEPITAGKPTAPDIKKCLTGKLTSDAVLVTDELRGYNYFSHTEQIEHIKIARDKHSKGAFSLSRVNSLHSAIDRFICIPEYRPATKYLDLYLKMFWWFQKNKDMNKNDQTTLLFSIMTGCVDAKDRAKMTRITIAELNARSLPIDTKGYY